MANKTELEQENKMLKEKVKQLLTVAKRQIAEDGEAELKEVGFSIVKIGEDYQLVEIAFDVESKVGKIISMQDVGRNTRNLNIALMCAHQYIDEKLLKRLQK